MASVDSLSCTLRALGDATCNFSPQGATSSATRVQPRADKPTVYPLTGRELRAQLRAQQRRNSELQRQQLREVESCGGATAANDAPEAEAPAFDPATERRRTRTLALLEANPNWRRAVIAEAGEPAFIGVAIRGLAYGELEIPAARYDPVGLLALLDHYGRSAH